MRIQEQISIDIKDAMKIKNVDKLAALRAAKSEIMLEVTKKGAEIVDDDISLKLIAKLVKQRKDSAAIFIQQKRQDLADDELNQLAYLQRYLPVQVSDDVVRGVVKEVIIEVGASSLADIGKCMGPLMQRLNGKADGSLISNLVREELS